MDSFSAPRYDTKIENFDPCLIDVNQHQQREITSNVVSPTTIQAIQEPHENTDSTAMNEENENSSLQVQPIQSNIQQNMTLTPVRLPAILDGEFFSVIRVDDSNVTVKCHQCQKLLNGNLKSTGNFLSHIKRLHPLLLEKIKSKSNLRKPALVYVDMSAEKCPEIVRTKRGYRKCYNAEETQMHHEDSCERSSQNGLESPVSRRRRSEEPADYNNDVVKLHQNNSFVMEDEFDAIGRNIAAKLRNMRLDQRIVAEKLLNDVLFEGQLGTLHRDSNIHV